MSGKIIRSICLFSSNPGFEELDRMKSLEERVTQSGFTVQTKRLVTKGIAIARLTDTWGDEDLFIGAGTLSRAETRDQLESFLVSKNISFNLEIRDHVTTEDVLLLFRLMEKNAEKTFNFSYTFNNVFSSPYFPAAQYIKDGFSIGLQPTDLTRGCNSLHTWLFRMKECWEEIFVLFKNEEDFLGIDSSIAPMYSGDSSLVHLMKRIHGSFENSVTTDTYTSLSNFIKEENPKPIGLNGLMFPCLEDFELAEEYEKGEFSIERNIFLSLHSGLGIDTYPIGIDEEPARVKQILNLLLSLAAKYDKPLSARFVSDGKACIGEKSDFKNEYLKDVVIKKV